MTSMAQIEQELSSAKSDIPELGIGDTVRVHVRITEGNKSRIQVYEGTVIGMSGGSNRGTFTVRKISYGVGVERIFPFHSPLVEQIEVKSRHKIRRAKLYYLRGRVGKATRLKEVLRH